MSKRGKKVPTELLGGVVVGGAAAKVVNMVTGKIEFLNSNQMLASGVKVLAGGYIAMYMKGNFAKGMGYGIAAVGGQELLGSYIPDSLGGESPGERVGRVQFLNNRQNTQQRKVVTV